MSTVIFSLTFLFSLAWCRSSNRTGIAPVGWPPSPFPHVMIPTKQRGSSWIFNGTVLMSYSCFVYSGYNYSVEHALHIILGLIMTLRASCLGLFVPGRLYQSEHRQTKRVDVSRSKWPRKTCLSELWGETLISCNFEWLVQKRHHITHTSLYGSDG